MIDEFRQHYRREIDFYQEVARLVAQQCEALLKGAGIRAIVTYRAKHPDSLERKLRSRRSSHSYSSLEDIQLDIVDLAGVRIALYFPGDCDEVGKLLRANFVLVSEPKAFPDGSPAPYPKQFSGYNAVHYRVQLKDSNLLVSQRRFTEARVEIQIASVLMHAWAEVEHDLVYKPVESTLSEDEYSILDELNGLVLSGEISLKRLQKSMEQRVSVLERTFRSHYDLAAYLYEVARPLLKEPGEPLMGRVDSLFKILSQAGLASPKALAPYVVSLHGNTEERPVAEQLTDLLLLARPELYEYYSALRSTERQEEPFRGRAEEERAVRSDKAVGEFMATWIAFERILQALSRYVAPNRDRSTGLPIQALLRTSVFPKHLREVLERLHRIRNQLVHGIEVPDPEYLEQSSRALHDVLDELERSPDPEVRRRVSEVRRGGKPYALY